ncbi:MAG: DsbA family oxidoreductase [Actinomycetota bacterium]
MDVSEHTDSPIESNNTQRPTVSVEIYSDVVCPWCYIGKRKFEAGLAEFRAEHGADVDVDVAFRPFQLDPTASPGRSGPVFDAYAQKFGGPERAQEILDHVTSAAAATGIEFRMDRALRANTLLAHRLLWLSEQTESPVTQDAMKERLLRAYFHDGIDIGDPDALADLAADEGFDHATVREFFDSDRGNAEVAAELRGAADRGVTAVPTFVFNDTWAVPGAQEPETFARVLTKMAANAG